MYEYYCSGSTIDIIAQYVAEMKTAQEADFSYDKVNLAKLERRTLHSAEVELSEGILGEPSEIAAVQTPFEWNDHLPAMQMAGQHQIDVPSFLCITEQKALRTVGHHDLERVLCLKGLKEIECFPGYFGFVHMSASVIAESICINAADDDIITIHFGFDILPVKHNGSRRLQVFDQRTAFRGLCILSPDCP